MTQLSRPYQVILAAVALLALVWVVALHGHAPGSKEATATPPPPAPVAKAPVANAQAEAEAAAKPTRIYHGPAPGVEGLTRAIAKAHGAVATSQRNARELQRRSSEASQETPAGSSSDAAGAKATPGTTAPHRRAVSRTHAAPHVHPTSRVHAVQHARATSHATPHAQSPPVHPVTPAAKHSADSRPAGQVTVEGEVAQGKTVLLLFWNSKSSVDRTVRSEAQSVVGSSKGRLSLHVATSSQVGEFGSLTEVVHVYQTPTILIVNRHGVVSTVTGLTDKFALEQLVREAQRAGK